MSILEVRNITKKDGENTVLDGVYFTVEDKGIYAILSKDVVGRTALAEVLSGCSFVDSGEVVYRDISVYSSNKHNCASKAKIGYVPRESFFFADMTVFEVLDFTGKMRGVSSNKRARQIKESLEIVKLSSKCEVYVKELSPSEKKRLSLANALIGNPPMLVLDNPCESVSANDSDMIKDILKMIGSKKVILLLTDRAVFAQDVAMNVGILANGKITLWDSMENVKERYEGDNNFLVKAFVDFSAES